MMQPHQRWKGSVFVIMLRPVLADLRLYQRLLAMQVRAQLQYRFNLLVSVLTIFLTCILEFSAVLLYFGRFPTILGWSVAQVMLLAALVALGAGLAHMFGAGVDNFDEVIRRGDFDRVMLRPAGTFMQIMGNDFRMSDVGRLLEGVLLLGVAVVLLPAVQWTPWKVLALALGILSNMAIFIGILLLGATLCFWTIETTELTNIPSDGGREMMNYPLTIYHPTLQGIFLFLIPLAFGAYLPACDVLGKPMPLGLPSWAAFASPVMAALFVLGAGCVWQVGVRHYQSTGS
jgi:ABC-2 type transport system permease protein